ncbi:hypothetical protein [Streptomyces flavofungini]|nr:hypothetical protein [Streptomyces flavofungini]WJV48927.1 hypothetical protein QUY26_27470 [Streptomyces flavofungini]
MNVIHALLVLAVATASGLLVLVADELRWQARNRRPRCTSCGQHHRNSHR